MRKFAVTGVPTYNSDLSFCLLIYYIHEFFYEIQIKSWLTEFSTLCHMQILDHEDNVMMRPIKVMK